MFSNEPPAPIPTFARIRQVTEAKLGKRPCLWQLLVIQTLLRANHNVTCISGTGSGKTLTFWMPLLFREGIQIVVMPLNILGQQNVQQLSENGILAVELNAKMSCPQVYRVRRDSSSDTHMKTYG